MKNSLKLLCAFLIGLGSAELLAQEPTEVEIGEVQTDEPNVEFGNTIVIDAEDLGDGLTTSSMRVIASEPGTTMAFATDGGEIMHFGLGDSDSFSLLNNRSIQKDLELVEEQMENIRAVQNDFSKQIREQMGDLSKGNFDPGRLAGLKDIIAEIQARKQEEINKLLLPHQQERLRQVALQMQMKNRGTASALTSNELAEELGMTQKQIEDLKARSKELQQEIAKKTQQLKDDAKQELLGMLSPSQQKKLKEMIGDEYKPEADDWQSGFPEQMRQRINRARSRDDN